MEKTLYVSDLDGTLLDLNDRISPKSLDIINRLIAGGMAFTYATARSTVSAAVVTAGLNTNIPVIAYNGALIADIRTHEVLSQVKYTPDEIMDIASALDSRCIFPLVYSYISGVEKVSWLTSAENDGMKRYLGLRKGDRRLNPLTERANLYLGDVFYVTCIGEKAELEPVYKIFSADGRFRCTIQQELYRPEYWCEIMPAEVSKAKAIMKLKKLLGYTKVVSFGDAINDIPMFEVSDKCCAVENASPELKKYADTIIGSNDKDGVALWLAEHAYN